MKKCGVTEILMKKMWRNTEILMKKCGVMEILMKKMWRNGNSNEIFYPSVPKDLGGSVNGEAIAGGKFVYLKNVKFVYLTSIYSF